MRAGPLAVVSIVAACLGAVVVLVVGSAAGWVGGESDVRTVVVPTVPTDSGAAAPTAAPLLGIQDGVHDALVLTPGALAGAHHLGVLTQQLDVDHPAESIDGGAPRCAGRDPPDRRARWYRLTP